MLANDKYQVIGPVAVIATVMSAQFGAYALATWPASSTLWYLNIEVFRPIDYGLAFEDRLLGPGGLAQMLCVVASLLGLIGIGIFTKCRLPLALASHLSLIYSGFLLFCCYVANHPFGGSSLKFSALWGPSLLLAMSVFLSSFLSSAVSHRSYWREMLS
jgi:hypothetical protein